MLLDYFKLPKPSSSLLTNLKLSLTCSAMLTHSLTHSLTGVVAIVSKTIGSGGSRALSGFLILIILWMLEGGRPQRSVRSCSSGRSSGHSGHTNYPHTSTPPWWSWSWCWWKWSWCDSSWSGMPVVAGVVELFSVVLEHRSWVSCMFSLNLCKRLFGFKFWKLYWKLKSTLIIDKSNQQVVLSALFNQIFAEKVKIWSIFVATYLWGIQI